MSFHFGVCVHLAFMLVNSYQDIDIKDRISKFIFEYLLKQFLFSLKTSFAFMRINFHKIDYKKIKRRAKKTESMKKKNRKYIKTKSNAIFESYEISSLLKAFYRHIFGHTATGIHFIDIYRVNKV